MTRALALSLFASSPALACAVCGAGQEAGSGSYVVMSIIISLLPLAMLGGILAWVVKSAREAARQAEQPEAADPAAGEVKAP